jgi:P27 family predicted phage terminase small subunit
MDDIVPTPPGWLDATGVAVWERVVGELARRNLLVDMDRDLLAGYCRLVSDMVHAAEDVNQNGRWDDKTGWERAATKTFRSSLKDLRLTAAELGITPSGRARGLLPGGEDEEDQFERDFGRLKETAKA